jgi:hypothetical protein
METAGWIALRDHFFRINCHHAGRFRSEGDVRRAAILIVLTLLLLVLGALAAPRVYGQGMCPPGSTNCCPPSFLGGWQGASVGTFGRAQVCPPQGGQVILRGGIGGASVGAGGFSTGPQTQRQQSLPSYPPSRWPFVVRLSMDLGGGHVANGSGCVIFARVGSPSLVLTCGHVMTGQTTVIIEFADGRKLPGKILVADGVLDAALVKFVGFEGGSFKEMLAADPPAGTSASYLGYTLDTGQGGVVTGVRFTGGVGPLVGYRGSRLVFKLSPLPPEGTSGGPIYTPAGVISIVSETEPEEGISTAPTTSQLRELICRHAPWAMPACCDWPPGSSQGTWPLGGKPPANQEPTPAPGPIDPQSPGPPLPESPGTVEPNGHVIEGRLVVIEKRLTTIESRITAIERLPLPSTGEKGDKGERGEKGEPGRDGQSPKIETIVDAVLAKFQDKSQEKLSLGSEVSTSAPVYWDIVPRKRK